MFKSFTKTEEPEASYEPEKKSAFLKNLKKDVE